MEKTFRNALKRELTRRIKGQISVHIIDDTLIVDVVDGVFNFWRYTIENLAVQLSVGLSSKIVADVITKQYKKHVLDIYFY